MNYLIMDETDLMVTLPSNSNMSIYPSNEPSNYTVKLAAPLDLSGNWEAALVSVQYTPSWSTFPKPINLVCFGYGFQTLNAPLDPVIEREDAMVGPHTGAIEDRLFSNSALWIRRITLQPQFYETPEALGKEICKVVNDAYRHRGANNIWQDTVILAYEFNVVSRKGHFATKQGYLTIYEEDSPVLAQLLGLSYRWIKCDKCKDGAQTTESTPHYFRMLLSGWNEPRIGKVSSLWIYTDITKYQLVGDARAPLLGIIPTQNDIGRRCHYTVNPVNFLAVNKSHIPEIAIKITDEYGYRIPFATTGYADNVVCCLRFRRRKANLPI